MYFRFWASHECIDFITMCVLFFRLCHYLSDQYLFYQESEYSWHFLFFGGFGSNGCLVLFPIIGKTKRKLGMNKSFYTKPVFDKYSNLIQPLQWSTQLRGRSLDTYTIVKRNGTYFLYFLSNIYCKIQCKSNTKGYSSYDIICYILGNQYED